MGSCKSHVFTPKPNGALALLQSWVWSRSVILSRCNSPALCSWRFSRPRPRGHTTETYMRAQSQRRHFSLCVCVWAVENKNRVEFLYCHDLKSEDPWLKSSFSHCNVLNNSLHAKWLFKCTLPLRVKERESVSCVQVWPVWINNDADDAETRGGGVIEKYCSCQSFIPLPFLSVF